jgi:hypothetical protein
MTDSEQETFPLEPRFHPVNRVIRKIYDLLASAKMAMSLLVVILACCVVGVTIFRGQPANDRIFSTLWFNGLLMLLVVNVACCFFGRIWGRRITLVSFGMILFHLSFVAVFLGVVYNSLFFFRSTIRLTEGETLRNDDPQSYDLASHGRFFRYTRLRGETSLVTMHAGYKADGKDKRVAYEVDVGDVGEKKRGIIYITKYLEYGGVKYFRDKEGYSLLLTLSDIRGRELYGAYMPLQSYQQKDQSFRYATGSKELESGAPIPHDAPNPLFDLKAVYHPTPLKERSGEVEFQIRKHAPEDAPPDNTLLAQGTAAVGAPFGFGAYTLSPREVRYWVAMHVTYEPGQPIILTSLWVGLAGMIITTVGRIIRGKS